MGLKEILAAKKAAEAGVTTLVRDTSEAVDVAVKEPVADVVKTMTPLQNEEPVVKPVEKPLTFAEKMLLKKQQAEAAKQTGSTSVVAAPVGNADSPTVVSSITENKESIQPSETTAIETKPPGVVAVLEDQPSDELAQAYADISAKIELLESLEDSQLENAMKELKQALMKNPNAVSLMLDTDYGKMVMALRKITREAQVEAVKEKKPGAKRQKNLLLSAEDVEAVFNEL